MKRATFLAVAAAISTGGWALGASVSTAVILSSSSADLDGPFLDYVAGSLRGRGVNVYDPSAADVSYHERASLVATVIGSTLAVSENANAWVEAHYHTRRAMFIEMKLSSTPLPYGNFIVYVVRATSAYRCFDTRSKSIIAAGTARGEARGEDSDLALEEAGNSSLLALAQSAAPKLL